MNLFKALSKDLLNMAGNRYHSNQGSNRKPLVNPPLRRTAPLDDGRYRTVHVLSPLGQPLSWHVAPLEKLQGATYAQYWIQGMSWVPQAGDHLSPFGSVYRIMVDKLDPISHGGESPALRVMVYELPMTTPQGEPSTVAVMDMPRWARQCITTNQAEQLAYAAMHFAGHTERYQATKHNGGHPHTVHTLGRRAVNLNLRSDKPAKQ